MWVAGVLDVTRLCVLVIICWYVDVTSFMLEIGGVVVCC